MNFGYLVHYKMLRGNTFNIKLHPPAADVWSVLPLPLASGTHSSSGTFFLRLANETRCMKTPSRTATGHPKTD